MTGRLRVSRSRNRISLLLAAIVLAAVVLAAPACGDSDDELIRAPEGVVFSDPVWLEAVRKVAVASQPATFFLDADGSEAGSAQLALVDLESGTAQEIELPNEEGCVVTRRLFPHALGDGRLAFIQDCVGEQRPADEMRTLRAWDPRSGEVEQLVSYRLHNASYRFSFSADLERGVIVQGRGGRGPNLASIDAEGLRALPTPLDEVSSAAVSPDGGKLAVVGVPNDSTRRMSLYLTDPEGAIERELVSDALEIRPPQWSPDGRRLAFVMVRYGESGVWVLVPSSGELRLVSRGDRYDTVGWLADGSRLVVSVGRYGEETERPNGLEILDATAGS